MPTEARLSEERGLAQVHQSSSPQPGVCGSPDKATARSLTSLGASESNPGHCLQSLGTGQVMCAVTGAILVIVVLEMTLPRRAVSREAAWVQEEPA